MSTLSVASARYSNSEFYV